ncbi:MAG: AAA-associated domain-containing protein [archaeon]|nr:AAA-associated domain-containing protein [archaeon]
MSIPRVHYSHLIGLLEALEDFGGKVDVAKIAGDLSLELDDLLPVVEAGELLGFLRAESGDILLTDEGLKFLSDGTRGRKKHLGKRLLTLNPFKKLIEFISQKEEKAVTKEELSDFLAKELHEVDSEIAFKWVIEWGRHGLLLRYNSKEDKIKLS